MGCGITVAQHTRLNCCQVTIFAKGLRVIPIDDLLKDLSPQSFTEVHRFDQKEIQMGPHGNQAGLLLERIYLPPPDHINPNILSGTSLRKLLHPLGNDERQRVMLDATLTSVHRATFEPLSRRWRPSGGTAPSPGEDGNLLGFTKAIWAPKGTAKADACLLCMVTFDHKVNLVGRCGVNWEVVYDLSSLWYSFSKEKGQGIVQQYKKTLGSEPHHKFIAKTQFLAVADVLWTNLFTSSCGESFCILILATASFHIGLIKVPTFNSVQFKPSVLDCLVLEDTKGKISALDWFLLKENEGFLAIGSSRGEVEIHRLVFQETEVTAVRLYRFENSLAGMITNQITMKRLDEARNMYVMFVGKHNVLLSHLLCMGEDDVKVLNSIHTYIGGFAISGLKAVDSNLVYASAKDGQFFEFEMEYDLKKNSHLIRSKQLLFSSDGVLYKGFCFSPNYSFMAILECVSVPYDHLVMKEPTVLSLLQINTYDTLLRHILTNDSLPLANQVDVFESLRLMIYRKEDPISDGLNIKDVGSLSPHHKRAYLWITFIDLGSLSRDVLSPARQTKEKLIKALEESILADYITKVLSKYNPKSFPSDPLHQLSLHQMCTFLQMTNHRISMIKSIKACLKKKNVSGVENCIVCKSKVEFTSYKIARCSQGHSLPRCPKSLISTTPNLKCLHCDLYYHPKTSEWYGEDSTCLICGKNLILRARGRRTSLLNHGFIPAVRKKGKVK